MTREQVFELINKEREFQDTTFDPNEVLDSGLTRLERDSEVLPHIRLIQDYAHEAGLDWTYSHKRGHKESSGNPSGSLVAAQGIAKIAAIAVGALERMPIADALLTKGLR
jgi:hypothetical protein